MEDLLPIPESVHIPMHHPIGWIIGIVCFIAAVGIKYNAYKRQGMNPVLGMLFYKGGQPYLSTKERIIGSALFGGSLVSMTFAFVLEITFDHILERAGIFVIFFAFSFITIFQAGKSERPGSWADRKD